MIEVLFAESEAASMKFAKKKWMSGKSHEVVCLCLMLDIGDIQTEIDSPYRKNLIYSLYDQGQWGNEISDITENKSDGKQIFDKEIFDKEIQHSIEIYMQEIKRLLKFLDDGESIRIWFSNAPYSRCGLYYLCHFLYYVQKRYAKNIHVVKLPEHVVREKTIVLYQNWGEVAPDEFTQFLPDEHILTENEVNLYASSWTDLVSDNSPLRAMVNGRITGVPEDFYDFLIFKKISKKPVKQCRLIGDILGCCQIGVWDWWYAKRIQHYIENGTIKIVENSDKMYARLICLA